MLNKNKVSSKDYFAKIKRKGDFSKLTTKEFSIFFKKFCGALIYRGKRGYSIKVLNYLLLSLKKEFKKDPTFLFYTVANRLMPVFIIGQKQYFNTVVDVPVLARGNKKNLYLLN